MLTNTEFSSRRQQLAQGMLPNSICLIPAAQLVTRSRDTEYAFRQDSYFHYLCGFPEPQAWLVLSNQNRAKNPKTVKSLSILFCLDKDEQAEIWQGRRFGPRQAKKHFELDKAFSLDELDEHLLELLDGHDNLYFAQGHNTEADELVFALLQALREAPKQSMQAPANLVDVRPLLDEMRLFKSPAEIAIMREAAQISGKAHIRAMESAKAGLNEYHLEAHIHHEFAMHGAKNPAYGTIVGSGVNACILHYTQNNQTLNAGDLVLIDAGCELQGYAADITRTFPVSGQFSAAQKQLYQLVLDAQSAALVQVKPGSTFKQIGDAAIKVITQGLIDLGLLSGSLAFNLDKQLYRDFFMHGIGHWLGLDVHDVGHYKIAGQDRSLQAGMVLTIEPGIYVAPDADVDDCWLGIGIRIEDNVLLTDDGFENLTQATPKTIVDIESLMAHQQNGKS
ncbi:Xaa-Pro aminopeptidase [Paraglaciecola hydrolytica]|uniref:Xaa-Pro aminopeptidase n=1 Tax=Paraglaciecola hydrolytica TaxID=1799789 RepID=A0A135ZYJ6_9ALTE|nr:Xaa-Pro aminopeptidase [Paraglaciecola hydrolytica]KXI28056.1 Xaa-Pro aminopeptidase [Paraglaciecola hydrolytica]